MASGLFLLFTISSAILDATASDSTVIQQACIYNLQAWFRGTRTEVTLHLLNDFNKPTWTSHMRTHLTLPRGVPFAFACRACYSPWKIPTLSLHTTGTEAEFGNVKSCSSQKVEHSIADSRTRTNCLVSYGLTLPLKSEGSLECELNRYKKLTKELVTYSTVEVETENTGVENVSVNYEGFVKVSCPEVRQGYQHFVYVWHLPNGQRGIVTQSLSKEVELRGHKAPYEVVCSTYDINYPTKVWKKSYRIHGHTDATFNANKFSNPNDEEDSSTLNLSNIALISGAVLVLLLLTSVLLAVCRETKLNNKRHRDMKNSLTERESLHISSRKYSNPISK